MASYGGGTDDMEGAAPRYFAAATGGFASTGFSLAAYAAACAGFFHSV